MCIFLFFLFCFRTGGIYGMLIRRWGKEPIWRCNQSSCISCIPSFHSPYTSNLLWSRAGQGFFSSNA